MDWRGGAGKLRRRLPSTADHAEGRLEPSGRSELQEMIGAYRVSQMLAVAARLRLADHLAAGARPVDELARVTGTHEDSLYRMLRALACFDVFAEEPGRRVPADAQGRVASERHIPFASYRRRSRR